MSQPTNDNPVQPIAVPAEDPAAAPVYAPAPAYAPAPVEPVAVPAPVAPVATAPMAPIAPVSAPVAQASAPPVYSAVPYGYAPAQEPKKSKAGLVFGILAVVFFLAAGALGGLYYLNKTDADKTIADQKTQIASLESQVKTKTDEVTTAKSQAAAAQSEAATAQREGKELTLCQKAVQNFFAELKKQDSKTAQAAVLVMAASCKVSLV